jgi:sugar phosphate isomerase/epimerase
VGRIGLQLYTVRRAGADDLAATVRAVGEMGFDGVEIFDLHGHEPARVRTWLDEARLDVCARHATLDAIESQLPTLVTEAEVLGWRRLVVSWVDPALIRGRADEVRTRLVHAAEEAAAAGHEVGYHNHDAEVRRGASGRSFLDDLPSELFVELDLGWAWWSGAEPVELLDRTRGRCPLVHVKDFRTRGEPPSYCPVGEGAVGFDRVAPAAVAAGVEWLIVEQDETDGDELDAARRSFEALTAMVEHAS